MQQTLTVKPVTFRQFVFTECREWLWWVLPAMVVLFYLYKLVYPFFDFYFDSFQYIHMAGNSDYLTVWPLGYPLFLRAVHWFSSSHVLLVAVQYGLLQLSSLWLIFTLFFLFRPPYWVKLTLMVFLVVNPLYWYIANLISSDVLFTILSLCWLTMLIWLVIKPNYWCLLLHGPLLAYAFLVRYQAAYYPLVMAVALLLANVTWGWRLLSAGIAVVLLAGIVYGIKAHNLRRFGSNQFAPQSSWMLANNALYMYPYVTINTACFAYPRLRQLHAEITEYMTVNHLTQRRWQPADGPRYMLVEGPMWESMVREIQRNLGQPVFWYYNRMGVDWNAYGKQLIKDHPLAYARYYLLPNTGVYLWPSLEQFRGYANRGKYQVSATATAWFRMSGNRVYTLWPEGSFYLLGWYRPLFLFINIGLLVTGALLLWKRRFRQLPVPEQYVLLITALLFAGNACLLIIAGPVMLRYQVYALTLGTVFFILMIPYLIRLICNKY